MTRIPASVLVRYLAQVYAAAGMTVADATTVAAAQVEADLRGIHGHGARSMPRYVAKLHSGHLNPRPHVTVLADNGVCLALDADLAPGAVAARAAVDAAVDRARARGVGLVTVRRAGHAGALGVHATRITCRGLIGIVAAQTSAASVALHGGSGNPVLGNTAVAVAIPGPDRRPVLVDMATGAMSWGAVGNLIRAGQALPPGYAVDRTGTPTTDPHHAAALLPGGGRGQALAIVLELLVGGFTGSAPLPTGEHGRGLLCLAIDPTHLDSAYPAMAGVRQVSHAIRRDGTRMPGDRAWTQHADSATHGIGLTDDDLCALLSVAPDLPAPYPLAEHYRHCAHHRSGSATDHEGMTP